MGDVRTESSMNIPKQEGMKKNRILRDLQIVQQASARAEKEVFYRKRDISQNWQQLACDRSFRGI